MTSTPSAPPRVADGALSGVGLGLRWPFLEELLEREDAPLSFVEVSPENYMRRGGYFPDALARAGERYAVLSHGLTMSLGGTDPLNDGYFRELKKLLAAVGATSHSDHLCWSGTERAMLHDLLPLPFTREAVTHVVGRFREARDRLEMPLAIENISYYAPLGEPEMTEAQFLCEVLDRTGGGLLLDVNNVLVNAINHRFDAEAFLEALPLDRVVQLHVAGHHRWDDDLLVDTHGATAPSRVHELMSWVIERTGPLPVILERDQLIPPLDDLLDEVRALQATYDAALARHRSACSR